MAGRPAKSVNMQTAHLTNEQIERRGEQETALRGCSDHIVAPAYLSEAQQNIFLGIVNELTPSGILGNLDIFIVTQCTIAIDRLQELESIINKDCERIFDRQLMSAKDKYTKDLYRCCNELSMSPQSRARMASLNLNAKKEQEDPILKVLRSGQK